MQTFLPYSNFVKTADCLDYRRLGKQRIEAKQILEINLIKTGKSPIDAFPGDLKIKWENHPAVLMWRGFELALCFYGFIMCCGWKVRGYKDNQQDFFLQTAYKITEGTHLMAYFHDGFLPSSYLPEWLFEEKLHISHRSNLLNKYPEYYSKFEWGVDENLPYYWPVRKGENND